MGQHISTAPQSYSHNANTYYPCSYGRKTYIHRRIYEGTDAFTCLLFMFLYTYKRVIWLRYRLKEMDRLLSVLLQLLL